RRPHHHVHLPRVPAQQHLEPRQQRHEQRHPFTSAQRPQPLAHFPRQPHFVVRSPIPLHRPTHSIRRQLQDLRRTCKTLPPIPKLPLQHLSRQPLPLPARKVPVLDGQLFQR